MTDRDDYKRLADRTTRNSIPQDGFDCVYLYENGVEVGCLNGPQNDPKVIDRAKHWERAASVKAGDVVAVKPLEWGPYPNPAFAGPDVAVAYVRLFDGFHYQAQRDPHMAGFMSYLAPDNGTRFWISQSHETIEAAKAAAQADYESHIRSALVVEPAPTASVGAMREALVNGAHYLGAIRQRLEQLYNEHPNEPSLREQISDEVDFIDGLSEAIASVNQPDGGGPKPSPLPANLAEVIETELMGWRGVNGGVYTIRAAALGVSCAIRSAAFRARNTESDVEALAATTAERPGTVTSEPEPSMSDTPPAPQAVEAVSVDEVAEFLCKLCGDYWWQSSPHSRDNARWIDRSRALLAEFKMEGR